MVVPDGIKLAHHHITLCSSKNPKLQVYDVESDTWYEGGSIPSKRFRFVAAALGDSIYIFGGQGALMGSHNTAGSKYPVLDVVDQYKETMTIGVTRF